MQRFEFYKSIYDRENLRRESLNNLINIPMGILTAIITGLVFLCSTYSSGNSLIDIIFYVLVCLCFLFCVISIFYLIQSFNRFSKGYEYKELPFLKVIEDYYDQLKVYYKGDIEKVERELEDFLISELILYTDINTKLNDYRSVAFYKTKKFIFFSLLVLTLICIPYVKAYSNHYIQMHKNADNKRSIINDSIYVNF